MVAGGAHAVAPALRGPGGHAARAFPVVGAAGVPVAVMVAVAVVVRVAFPSRSRWRSLLRSLFRSLSCSLSRSLSHSPSHLRVLCLVCGRSGRRGRRCGCVAIAVDVSDAGVLFFLSTFAAKGSPPLAPRPRPLAVRASFVAAAGRLCLSGAAANAGHGITGARAAIRCQRRRGPPSVRTWAPLATVAAVALVTAVVAVAAAGGAPRGAASASPALPECFSRVHHGGAASHNCATAVTVDPSGAIYMAGVSGEPPRRPFFPASPGSSDVNAHIRR